MSVAGLKKQFHKATQRVSEKVGGAEGTKLDDDFRDMEKKVEVTSRAILDIMTKTTEYLQPNPASRARLSMISTMSKIRGQEKGPGYPQAEAVLGEAMQRFGRELGEESSFGLVLLDAGEAMRELGEVKDALDMEVKQNFIDPLQNLHDKDVKEIQGKVQEEDIRQALEKFDESKEIAEQSMIKEVSSQPRKEFTPKPRTTLELLPPSETLNGGLPSTKSPSKSPAPMSQPSCRAIYDFEPENEGELGFKEGDVITLTNQIDDNWYEGTINGQSGFFPINYVDILVALPH
ncbi:hypothetical protein CRUP_024267 [Coryphaenoides rupestris]|nr:hypothetical protein CRUP_024267 [Coryphaenoides rupestris]